MNKAGDLLFDPVVLAAERKAAQYSGADVSGLLRALGLTVRPFGEPIFCQFWGRKHPPSANVCSTRSVRQLLPR